jgi:Putative beta-barrel porin-2, OmpL-like. bbp2
VLALGQSDVDGVTVRQALRRWRKSLVQVLASVFLAIVTTAAILQAQADTSARVSFGGFVDTYYAWDFSRPRSLDRAYTTQPARHNEFNVNLAHVEAVLSGPNVRGRVALQYGTSVQANYAAEPRVGNNSGGELARHIQEAFVGVRLGRLLWLDGGIYLSHIGSESWISRDNLTYSRSLIADYSPYYQSGARLTWQPSSAVTAQLNVVNGWQTISESNQDKSVGARIDWVASPRVTVAAYNLIGSETPDSSRRQMRIFQGATLKINPTDHLTLQGTFDVGHQRLPAGGASWYGGAIVARAQVAPKVAIAGRIERYVDDEQIIVVTGTTDAFRATGASLGLDLVPAPRAVWRTEFRALGTSARIVPGHDGLRSSNAVLVSSLAVTF